MGRASPIEREPDDRRRARRARRPRARGQSPHPASPKRPTGGDASVLISGDAGVGKSRLLRHFEAGLAGGRPTIAFTRCVEFVQTPLAPLRDLLQQLEGRGSAHRMLRRVLLSNALHSNATPVRRPARCPAARFSMRSTEPSYGANCAARSSFSSRTSIGPTVRRSRTSRIWRIASSDDACSSWRRTGRTKSAPGTPARRVRVARREKLRVADQTRSPGRALAPRADRPRPTPRRGARPHDDPRHCATQSGQSVFCRGARQERPRARSRR